MKVLILGVNGFIGSNLTERILNSTDWEIYGIDISSDKLEGLLNNHRFHFLEGDITINNEWIEYHVRKCDVILPLVAIATPAIYVKYPLETFELGFEANLKIIRQCVKYNKRLVFPSTSEVYGMCQDSEFDEENSPLVLGPINKQRWIYSCSKQLLDRVIWAYGFQRGLVFTLFRAFNWIGPKLDDVNSAREGSSRVLIQFLDNIIRKKPIKLVDGGNQRRSFTYIDDGIDCLIKIIRNDGEIADGKIFNIGNPQNDLSIKELAYKLLKHVKRYPRYRENAEHTKIIEVSSHDYYGEGYQDILTRVPSIKKAHQLLNWQPKVDLDTAIKKTLDFYLQ